MLDAFGGFSGIKDSSNMLDVAANDGGRVKDGREDCFSITVERTFPHSPRLPPVMEVDMVLGDAEPAAADDPFPATSLRKLLFFSELDTVERSFPK